jgi:hypothetical protein
MGDLQAELAQLRDVNRHLQGDLVHEQEARKQCDEDRAKLQASF